MANKILFIDFDGVLNNKEMWCHASDNTSLINDTCQYLSQKLVEKLNLIIEVTNCDIVISSSWRTYHPIKELKSFLVKKGFKYSEKIIDVTPDVNAVKREYEINVWLTKNPTESYAILDDIAFDIETEHPKRFVKTNSVYGLLDEDVKKVIEILNG